MSTNPRIVITGGPGSGKTTLIEALAAAGHVLEPEAGRAVIRQQQAEGGDGLPWRDQARFAELMLDATSPPIPGRPRRTDRSSSTGGYPTWRAISPYAVCRSRRV